RLEEIAASLREGRAQRQALLAETRRTALDALSEGERNSASLQQELVKANQRGKLMDLTAPVDGTVQQLAVHTVGGVVTPAQPLMMLAPMDNPLEVEAYLENKDIGFVKPNQDAEVKVQSFPYTKYGTIPATVSHVSRDAIDDQKRGLIYAVRVKLQRAAVRVEDDMVKLTPGMAVSVEIKTGRRRVIEYFLDPLQQYRQESLRER
ncbi:MAG: HlyD family type I secretion periplasmic adaptor subunit, partial [Noviherbaspirillum sp.]